MIPFIKGIAIALLCVHLLQPVACEGNTTEPFIPDAVSDNSEFKAYSSPLNTSDRPTFSHTVAIAFESSVDTQSVSASIQDVTEAVTEEEEHITTQVYISTVKTSVNTEPSLEKAPEQTHAVWDSKGKICILAKFQAKFAITYPTKDGDKSVSVELPKDVTAKGKCGDNSNSPVLRLLWSVFEFTLTFSTIPREEPGQWVMTNVELRYGASPELPDLFEGAVNSKKEIAKSKAVELFKTDIGRSYFCSAEEVINLYSYDKVVTTVRMKKVQLQPYDVNDGKFSKAQRCNQVVIESSDEPFVQDETVPLAVGLTLTILTLVVVLGFSIHRAYTMRKVDYNSME